MTNKKTGRLNPKYYQLYSQAHNNAVDLLAEAELLFAKNRYARAYFLAFSGLEEIAKSQLAADVYTGYISVEDFKKHFTKHDKKIGRVMWATLDAQGYFVDDPDEIAELEASHPTIKDRMAALYTDFAGDNIVAPEDTVDKGQAERIIHILTTAIQRIVEVEYTQDRIGTKGFMK